MAATKAVRAFLPELIEKYGIETVADIGCGDRHWVSKLDWSVEYDGYDVDPFDDKAIKFDAINEVLPKAYDLVMAVYVMNHFKNDKLCARMVDNIKASGAKYLFATDITVRATGKLELEMLGEPLESKFHKSTPVSKLDCFYRFWALQ